MATSKTDNTTSTKKWAVGEHKSGRTNVRPTVLAVEELFDDNFGGEESIHIKREEENANIMWTSDREESLIIMYKATAMLYNKSLSTHQLKDKVPRMYTEFARKLGGDISSDDVGKKIKGLRDLYNRQRKRLKFKSGEAFEPASRTEKLFHMLSFLKPYCRERHARSMGSSWSSHQRNKVEEVNRLEEEGDVSESDLDSEDTVGHDGVYKLAKAFQADQPISSFSTHQHLQEYESDRGTTHMDTEEDHAPHLTDMFTEVTNEDDAEQGEQGTDADVQHNVQSQPFQLSEQSPATFQAGAERTDEGVQSVNASLHQHAQHNLQKRHFDSEVAQPTKRGRHMSEVSLDEDVNDRTAILQRLTRVAEKAFSTPSETPTINVVQPIPTAPENFCSLLAGMISRLPNESQDDIMSDFYNITRLAVKRGYYTSMLEEPTMARPVLDKGKQAL